jgi:hypothetical protein
VCVCVCVCDERGRGKGEGGEPFPAAVNSLNPLPEGELHQ